MICKDWIEAQGFQTRHGANYFSALKNIRDADPEDYFLSRDISIESKTNLTREWQRWIHLFKSSGVQCLVDLSLSFHNTSSKKFVNLSSAADNAIQRLLVKSRSLQLLATSVEQLQGSDRKLTMLLNQNNNKHEENRKRHHDRIAEKGTKKATLKTSREPETNSNTLPVEISSTSTRPTPSPPPPKVHSRESNLESSTVEVDDRWSRLLLGTVNKLRGQDTPGLDKIPTDGLSDLEVKIFSNSRSLIEQAELSVEDAKDLMVGMSGILDTRTWICEEAPSTLEPKLSTENKELDQLLTQLRKCLQLGIQMLVLKGEVMIGEIAKATIEGQDRPCTTPMLRCIVHLATMIEYGNLPSSESEVVALWKFILETLSCGQLKFSSGEKICRATQVAQRLLFLKFGMTGETENGRRVDLLLKEGDLEILNTEAKSGEDGGLCEIQYKKNVRINHTIHREASRKGIELPPMLPLDIRGMSAMICGLKRSQGVLVAGAADSRMIRLPSDKEQMSEFLSGPSPTLLCNYVEMLIAYQKNIREQRQKLTETAATTRHIANERRQDQKEKRSAATTNQESTRHTSPPRKTTLQLGELTILTPKKSRKRIKAIN
ncbi:hypothetical protein BG015_004774 [Linnemannia schmuckeri]|uniref:Uncharacterized protein n=1 Tax=Linnemannia schmuckeri TaxID=64567 RepID=A0A9P5S1K1_9FUNG|nr:hypothetical protein BG015_004774 [Linnemannia schmuckeri]